MSLKKSKLGGFEKFNRVPPYVNVIIAIIFIILAIVCILPVVLVFMVSISSEQSIQNVGYRFWPTEFSSQAYSYLYNSKDSILRAFGVSIIVTILGTIVGLILNTSIAYALSRKNFKFKSFFTWVIFIPMLFNGGMISSYIVVSNMLKLKDTIWALILPMAVSSFNIIILRTFFQTTIPDSLIESAKLDGANQMRIFTTIVLPISLPAIATIGLFLTFAYWNDWYNALLYIDNSTLVPIQALLNRIQGDIAFINQNVSLLGASAAEVLAKLPSESVRMAIVILVVFPIACSYPFFQKYFISGLTIGAVKE
ncbi:carbohydrate ABC transporter permease [uncultured Tyzzerella sp.]|uniref:carbohydrate ABC transporter permease n=1 Tax=uncultured Tyzzerella sp. TaxID=2321398 RepID=UPI0029437AB0|nr:carbohydrate ABC transporter permease [uncultured Tyzzerella sp.]